MPFRFTFMVVKHNTDHLAVFVELPVRPWPVVRLQNREGPSWPWARRGGAWRRAPCQAVI